MNTFYFESGLADSLDQKLSNMKETLDSISEGVKKVREELGINTGFGIEQIIEDVGSTIGSITFIGNSAVAGAQAIKAIKGSLEDHSAEAAGIVAVADDFFKKTSGKVSEWKKNADSTASKPTEKPVSKWPAGVVVNEGTYEKDGLIYTPLNHNGNTVLLRTDGAGGIGIFKADGSAYDGYCQKQSWWWNNDPNKARVDPSVECTSAALATCSTINGIAKMPDDYNNYSGVTQISGYKYSSEDVTSFCVENLKLGNSTVIYYNYAGYGKFGENGHAVTVVGADPNPTSVYDLWVIDPVDGQSKPFGNAYGVKSDNFYICYECSPGEYGGAAAKSWDITQYFDLKRSGRWD